LETLWPSAAGSIERAQQHRGTSIRIQATRNCSRVRKAPFAAVKETGASCFDLQTERSVRTTNAIERLHEEFKRRIKTQTVLPSTDTAAMLFWALLASGQISMRKVDGWKTLAEKL
jgi:transposase-like protein